MKSLLIGSVILVLVSIYSCKNEDEIPVYEDIEMAVFHGINYIRDTMGLDTLVWSNLVAEKCRKHSYDFVSGTLEFSEITAHNGFESRVLILFNALNLSGDAAENVAKAGSVEIMLSEWFKSSDHKRNLTGNYQITGVGIAKKGEYLYATQIFLQSQ